MTVPTQQHGPASVCVEILGRVASVLARVRQKQDRAENAYANGAMVERDYWRSVIDDERELAADAERERDEAVARTYPAVDRANAAEAALSRVEKITAAERAVVRAAVEHAEASDIAPTWGYLCDAVRALRDAQETGQ